MINSLSKKYGVMWASTPNIGDDIQTIAAIEFLKYHNIYEYTPVDREFLKEYNGDAITLIMNGWFMHDINMFPPSEKITPIFISVHVVNPNLIINNINYFKKYQPIGCRDTYTMNLFKENGIDAYFTGCMTLILPIYNGPRSGKLIVDVNTVSYIPKVNINLSDVTNYQVVTNLIPDINRKYDFKYKLSCAYELLDLFKKSELIVTSRLHCALPCRAFGTPVKFIHSEFNNNERFKGLEEILSGSDELKKCNENIDRNIFKEKVDFFINYKL